jgi:hypothetical protein
MFARRPDAWVDIRLRPQVHPYAPVFHAGVEPLDPKLLYT